MWLSNCCPLSELITLGIPNLQTMFFQTNFCILVSVITAKGSCGSGPIMSIPYIENGQREEILVRCFVGTCCTFPNRWHLSHLWTTSIASFYMVSQKYLARIPFPPMIVGLSGCCTLLHGLLATRTLLPLSLDTLGRGVRIPFCKVRHSRQ